MVAAVYGAVFTLRGLTDGASMARPQQSRAFSVKSALLFAAFVGAMLLVDLTVEYIRVQFFPAAVDIARECGSCTVGDLVVMTKEEHEKTKAAPGTVTHGTPLRLDSRLPLSVRCQPGAMHALQGPCPIGDRSDQRRSGEAPGLALIPMPALRVEAQRAHVATLGEAPGAEVGFRKRACDRHRGRKQARGGFWCSARGLWLLGHGNIWDYRRRTAKMRAGLGQKIGKAGDARPFANDVEEIAVFAGCGIGVFPSCTRPRGRPDESHEERAARVVLQIADHPVGAFPPPGGKVVTTNAFGMGRKLAQEVFCFQ